MKEGDPNLGVIAETLTELALATAWRKITCQPLKMATNRAGGGWRAGTVLPGAYSAGGETRGNLAAGGRGEPRPLTEMTGKSPVRSGRR